jgi:hypothetical protein
MRFGVLMALKTSVFWDVTPCDLAEKFVDDSEDQSCLFTARLAYYSILKTKAGRSSETLVNFHPNIRRNFPGEEEEEEEEEEEPQISTEDADHDLHRTLFWSHPVVLIRCVSICGSTVLCWALAAFSVS